MTKSTEFKQWPEYKVKCLVRSSLGSQAGDLWLSSQGACGSAAGLSYSQAQTGITSCIFSASQFLLSEGFVFVLLVKSMFSCRGKMMT